MTRRTSRLDSQPANADKYGAQIKRGTIIKFPGGATATVGRVYVGLFWTTALPKKAHPCRHVEVVTHEETP